MRKAQRQQRALEDEQFTLEEREHRYNPRGFFVVLEVIDPAGFSRMGVTTVYDYMKDKKHVPGFVPTPYKEMHTCPFLCQVPEYCLTPGYDLKKLWRLLKEHHFENRGLDTLLIAHACDWGRENSPCMSALKYLKRALEKENIWNPFSFLCGCFGRHCTVIAGGKKNRNALRNNNKTKK